jgi:DNA-binding transcriptional MerR regulator
MMLDTVHAVFIDRTLTLSEAEIMERSGLTALELHALAECGALIPADSRGGTYTYTIECLTVARTASRLRDELAIEDTHALAVVLRLTQRVDALQEELARLRARRR